MSGFPLPFRLALRVLGALKVLGLRPGEPLLPRLLFMGADSGEAVDALRRIRSVSDWVREWTALGEKHEEFGRQAVDGGDSVGAVESLTRAVAYLRVAEYLEADDQARRRLWTHLVAVSALVAEHSTPRVVRRDIPVPTLLSLPGTDGPAPCVLTLGGVDGVKEEFFGLLAAYAARGWAGVALDLPGQGELRRFGGVPWRADAETVVSEVIDGLVKTPEIDPERIVVVGGSAGGYFALRIAATDHRIAGCAVISAPVRLLDVYASAPEPIPRTMRYNLKAESAEAAREALRAFDVEPLLGDITCPVLQIHGGRDGTVPIGQSEPVRTVLGDLVQTVVYPDGDHMCFNHRPAWEATLRGWLTERFTHQRRMPCSNP
ncbi:alpha/beta hydrolase family protein [Lentzea nigeriaca]|uniref:alpha/beta hydrolase family protein n=1 Tax=Lentzea nigeriaca TaxID=1128665 RepID=UPI00195B4071|nr:alpha/beta fold hydrolase [Lentzea nigeriaca]MBM7858592.1 pimeloyl-ACP methyl ester carboxylesterase [Lentzea nigeriaca]